MEAHIEPGVKGTDLGGTYHAVILGAGVSGLCMGRGLLAAGIKSFVIIEKSAGIGGTWWDNTYPGAECDVPAHLYSYSFDPNPDWSCVYASRREIQQYLARFADKSGLLPHIRLNAKLLEARFDEQNALWQLRLANGEQLLARHFVCSAAPLSEPKYPEIPGIKTFQGRLFHSARWDRNYPLSGMRVAVIGTAASAAQLVPHIAPLARKLYVCQRSPAWIVPRANRSYTRLEKALFKVRLLSRVHRALIYAIHEMDRLAFNPGGLVAKIGRGLAEFQLWRQVRNKKLRAALRPDYPFGCKRVLLSNEYYPALTRSNVELVTSAIERIEPDAILSSDGQRREVDAIVCATGFNIKHVLTSTRITGRKGISLNEAWANEPEAYRGVAVAGFPNLFLLLGPNTGQGHTSAILYIEAQVNYVLQCLKELLQRDRSFIEVKPEAMAGYNEILQKTLASSVWAAPCRSWYKTASGKIIGIYPGFSFEYMRELRKPRFEDYVIG